MQQLDAVNFQIFQAQFVLSLGISENMDKDTERPRGRKSQVHYVAVKRTEIESTNAKDESTLCGLVFVERRHTALALNKLIQELVNWEPDLFFVQSSHMTG